MVFVNLNVVLTKVPTVICNSSPGDVSRCVQEILLRSLAVEPDGNKVTLVLLHHELEVGVGEKVLVLEPRVVEHAVDQLGHVVVGEGRGACNVHERAQHLGQFALVDDPVAIVVAHVEDDA